MLEGEVLRGVFGGGGDERVFEGEIGPNLRKQRLIIAI